MAENISFDPSKKVNVPKGVNSLSDADGSFADILNELDIHETEDVSALHNIDTRDMGKVLSSEFYTRVNDLYNKEFKIQGLG